MRVAHKWLSENALSAKDSDIKQYWYTFFKKEGIGNADTIILAINSAGEYLDVALKISGWLKGSVRDNPLCIYVRKIEEKKREPVV